MSSEIVSDTNFKDRKKLEERSGLRTLQENRFHGLLTEVFKARRGISPLYMSELFKTKTVNYDLLRKDQLYVSHKRTTKYGLKTFSHVGATAWNKLPNELKECESVQTFKAKLSRISHKHCVHKLDF
jgi:hypothetical protein